MPSKASQPEKGAKPSMPSFIRKGKEGINRTEESQFVKMPANEMIMVVPLTGLDDMISYDQHSIWLDGGNSPQFPCSQTEDCPGCMIGDKPRPRGLLNVMQKDAETGEPTVRVWAIGMSIMKALADIEESLDEGDLTGKVIKVKRTGSQLTTKYSVIPTASTAKTLPPKDQFIDLVSLVGETDRNKIIAMLEEAGKWKGKKSKQAADEDFETDADEDVNDEAEESENDDGDWS